MRNPGTRERRKCRRVTDPEHKGQLYRIYDEQHLNPKAELLFAVIGAVLVVLEKEVGMLIIANHTPSLIASSVIIGRRQARRKGNPVDIRTGHPKLLAERLRSKEFPQALPQI